MESASPTDGNAAEGAALTPPFRRAVAPAEQVRREAWGREWGQNAKQAAAMIRAKVG